MNDIIAAIATPIGTGGISIIRISGNGCISKINKLFKKDLEKFQNNSINFCKIYNQKGKIIDEVLVSIFKNPNSFTGFDTVEINCHGGIFVTNLILKEVLKINGIRLSMPGEFTKQSFLNGKKTLQEANGLMDLINANTEKSHEIALKSISGKTTLLIENLRNELLEIITRIEVNIDYPEYSGVTSVENTELKFKIIMLIDKINQIIIDSRKGEILKTGITTAIVGLPNVGKSSLLNNLSRTDRSIVTDIKGTTRDTIELQVQLGGIVLNLIDTAGIRKTSNIIEKIGIEKSYEMIEKAEFIIFMIEAKENLSKEELEIYEKIKVKKHIVLVNKIDLFDEEKKLDIENKLYISIKEEKGLEEIEKTILNIFDIANFDVEQTEIVTNLENIVKLENVRNLLKISKENIDNGLPIDLVEIDLKEALFLLGELLGIEVKSNLLDELFSRFCLGK